MKANLISLENPFNRNYFQKKVFSSKTNQTDLVSPSSYFFGSNTKEQITKNQPKLPEPILVRFSATPHSVKKVLDTSQERNVYPVQLPEIRSNLKNFCEYELKENEVFDSSVFKEMSTKPYEIFNCITNEKKQLKPHSIMKLKEPKLKLFYKKFENEPTIFHKKLGLFSQFINQANKQEKQEREICLDTKRTAITDRSANRKVKIVTKSSSVKEIRNKIVKEHKLFKIEEYFKKVSFC